MSMIIDAVAITVIIAVITRIWFIVKRIRDAY